MGGSSPEAEVGVERGTCAMQEGVLACDMCGAKVGMWSFAGQTPEKGESLPELLFQLICCSYCIKFD